MSRQIYCTFDNVVVIHNMKEQVLQLNGCFCARAALHNNCQSVLNHCADCGPLVVEGDWQEN